MKPARRSYEFNPRLVEPPLDLKPAEFADPRYIIHYLTDVENLHAKKIREHSPKGERNWLLPEHYEEIYHYYEALAEANPPVTLYHQMPYPDAYSMRNALSEGHIQINASSPMHFYGQGIYFGLNRAFVWVDEKTGGECYIFRDVPVRETMPGVSGNACQPMACLPISQISGIAEYNPTETISMTQNQRAFMAYPDMESVNIYPVYKDSVEPVHEELRPGIKYFDVTGADITNPAKKMWWKFGANTVASPMRARRLTILRLLSLIKNSAFAA